MTHRRVRCLAALAAVTTAAAACAPKADDQFVRGHGLQVAELSLQDRAQIYQEAIGGAFQVGDPSLYLLLDPRALPRAGGYGGGPSVTQALQNVMLASHIVQGTCVPTSAGEDKLAHCEAPLAGYVVRFSDVFRAAGDTMSVYLYVQRYSTPASVGVGRLRFERIYKEVKQGSAWVAVAEGRVQLNSQ